MLKNWTFGRILTAAFAVAGVALLVFAVVGYRNARSLIADQDHVRHTHEVRAEITRLLSSVADAETGQRGYVITRDEAYLAPYNTALVDIQRTKAKLRSLVSDNPGQLQRLDAAENAIEAKLAELKEPITARREESFEAAQAIVNSDRGHTLMTTIRTNLSQMEGEEDRLLEERTQVAEEAALWTQRAMSWGGAGALILFAVVAWFTIRHVSRKINGTVAQVQSASAELQAAANQQVSSARESEGAMTQILATFEHLLETSQTITKEAQVVSTVGEATSKASKAGTDTLRRTQESIAAIHQQMDMVVQHTVDLRARSLQIDGLLRLVEEIAGQTNILATNATIEAAGADRHRLGLVADEIRKLADRVAGATKTIRASIDSMRTSLSTTVGATETGGAAVLDGTKAFNGVTRSFADIHALVDETRDRGREIELSTKQQATAIEQIHAAARGVSEATQEHVVASRETLRTAAELQKLSADLHRLVASASSSS